MELMDVDCQTDRLACPGCSTPLERADSISCPSCGPVATWVSGERRIEWRLPSLDDAMGERIEGERQAWDVWAAGAEIGAKQPRASDWLASTRTMRAAAGAAPGFRELSGKRMLDIGSTCRHSVKFMKDGLERVDQIEVSAESQRFALRRLAQEGVATERVLFHTVPAEHLPFEDETFDLVFSSGTIHHTLREQSLPEVHRVLKPGGEFLFIESYLPALLQPLMRWRRSVAVEDRGTDAPLGSPDLRIMRILFNNVRLYPFNVLWLPWSQTFARTGWGRAKRDALVQADEKLGNAAGLGYLIGTQCWVAGRKS